MDNGGSVCVSDCDWLLARVLNRTGPDCSGLCYHGLRWTVVQWKDMDHFKSHMGGMDVQMEYLEDQQLLALQVSVGASELGGLGTVQCFIQYCYILLYYILF